MKNCDGAVEINFNPNRPHIPDHPYNILIIGGSGLGKTKLNYCVTKLKKTSTIDIDKICLYVKDPFKSKYQLLINGRKKVGIKE